MVLDTATAFIVLGLAALGFLRGFIREVFGICGMAASVVATVNYRDYFSDIYVFRLHSEVLAGVLSCITVFVGTMMCAVLVNGLMVRILAPLRSNALDRVAGSIVGVTKGIAISFLLFFVAETFLYVFAPRSEDDSRVVLPTWFVETYSYNFFSLASSYFDGMIPEPTYDKVGVIAKELLGKRRSGVFDDDV